ncbi:MAG: FtsX-like permease family protein [Halofilum sp. (in: g-proteobacteria)]|nr:FtsX-like permease family protein [Halofilum sp. (in: g-proteobacteria)]
MADIARAFPGVTVLDVEQILEQVRGVIAQGTRAVEYVFVFTLLAGVVVLVAAVLASRDERRVEIALLRTLGASRARVRAILAAEFCALGTLAGAIAAAGAATTGWAVTARGARPAVPFQPVAPGPRCRRGRAGDHGGRAGGHARAAGRAAAGGVARRRLRRRRRRCIRPRAGVRCRALQRPEPGAQRGDTADGGRRLGSHPLPATPASASSGWPHATRMPPGPSGTRRRPPRRARRRRACPAGSTSASCSPSSGSTGTRSSPAC